MRKGVKIATETLKKWITLVILQNINRSCTKTVGEFPGYVTLVVDG